MPSISHPTLPGLETVMEEKMREESENNNDDLSITNILSGLQPRILSLNTEGGGSVRGRSFVDRSGGDGEARVVGGPGAGGASGRRVTWCGSRPSAGAAGLMQNRSQSNFQQKFRCREV
eukprot:TRINITY_DN44057_c0_g1_i1.p1 TRINITY_DN44057_c0_g1~~TRINITY_DN44057_c0_g1_i1.p1  ORF type:complete len:119 (-),score=16.61 TRINITY_DN44057_c0_g1_i1:91-447(-)